MPPIYARALKRAAWPLLALSCLASGNAGAQGAYPNPPMSLVVTLAGGGGGIYVN